MKTLSIFSRRDFLGSFLLGAGAASSFFQSAQADLQVTVSGAEIKAVPIGIIHFGDKLDTDLADVVIRDLGRSGRFRVLRLPKGSAATFDDSPDFSRWAGENLEGLLMLRTKVDFKVSVDFRLWSIPEKRVLTAKHYETSQVERRVAHLIADQTFTAYTGLGGFFDTRFACIIEEGDKRRRRKSLAVLDQDGANLHLIDTGDFLAVSPSFSPDGKQIVYVGFSKNPPTKPLLGSVTSSLYILDIERGERISLGSLPGSSYSPRFSPDGRSLIMSLQRGSVGNIYLMDVASRRLTQLTSASAIDTSPSFSPEGGKIVFASNRTASQQLYVMNRDGSDPRRISSGVGQYSTPVWSPRGDLIAFTRQKDNVFSIGVMKPDGSEERMLAAGYHNEGPSWAPNGAYLVYFSEAGEGPSLYVVSVEGKARRLVAMPSYASDPSWSPLLSAS